MVSRETVDCTKVSVLTDPEDGARSQTSFGGCAVKKTILAFQQSSAGSCAIVFRVAEIVQSPVTSTVGIDDENCALNPTAFRGGGAVQLAVTCKHKARVWIRSVWISR